MERKAKAASPLIEGIRTALNLLVEPGTVVELRALNVVDTGLSQADFAKAQRVSRGRTFSGYFDSNSLDEMAEAAALLTTTLNSTAGGVYLTLNPVKEHLLDRRKNRVGVSKQGETTPDERIRKRRWLVIDTDPVRKGTCPSADSEKKLAEDLILEIRDYLNGQGWPNPIFADSGNGYHLLFRIDLPPNDDGLTKAVLKALSQQFSTDAVQVDEKVFNPARITKLYGTWGRKGDQSEDRPYRLSRIIDAPKQVGVVSESALLKIANRPKPTISHLIQNEPSEDQSHLSDSSPTSRDPAPGVPEHEPLTSALEQRVRKYLEKVPGAVEGDGGDCATYRVACILVLEFNLAPEDALPLFLEWNQKCEPPWEVQDLQRKLESADSERSERGRLLNGSDNGRGERHPEGDQTVSISNIAIDPSEEIVTTETPAPNRHKEDGSTLAHILFGPCLTAKELDQLDLQATGDWLVDGVFINRAATVIGGREKTLKTSIALDLAVSVSTETMFLGKFKIPKKRSVVMFCGESGRATIQETVRRICQSKGLEESPSNLLFYFKPPPLGHKEIAQQLRESIRGNGAEVLIIDPLYLSLSGGNRHISPSNVFEMGTIFREINEACDEIGCTPVVLHHSRKSLRYGRFMDLQDFSFSGIPEFARQWLLLNRRKKYQPGSGDHHLLANVGGSSGVSERWRVSIYEGKQNRELNARVWEPDVVVGEGTVESTTSLTGEAQSSASQKPERNERLLLTIQKLQEENGGNPVPRKAIKARAKLNGKDFSAGLHYLEQHQRIQLITMDGEKGHFFKVVSQ